MRERLTIFFESRTWRYFNLGCVTFLLCVLYATEQLELLFAWCVILTASEALRRNMGRKVEYLRRRVETALYEAVAPTLIVVDQRPRPPQEKVH